MMGFGALQVGGSAVGRVDAHQSWILVSEWNAWTLTNRRRLLLRCPGAPVANAAPERGRKLERWMAAAADKCDVHTGARADVVGLDRATVAIRGFGTNFPPSAGGEWGRGGGGGGGRVEVGVEGCEYVEIGEMLRSDAVRRSLRTGARVESLGVHTTPRPSPVTRLGGLNPRARVRSYTVLNCDAAVCLELLRQRTLCPPLAPLAERTPPPHCQRTIIIIVVF